MRWRSGHADIQTRPARISHYAIWSDSELETVWPEFLSEEIRRANFSFCTWWIGDCNSNQLTSVSQFVVVMGDPTKKKTIRFDSIHFSAWSLNAVSSIQIPINTAKKCQLLIYARLQQSSTIHTDRQAGLWWSLKLEQFV